MGAGFSKSGTRSGYTNDFFHEDFFMNSILAYKDYDTFFTNYFASIVDTLHHPHIATDILCFTIKCSIPTNTHLTGTVQKHSVSVVYPEIFDFGNSDRNGTENIIR